MKKSSSHNSSVCLCAQGFPGDFGERGPPGPDGNPVSGTDVSQQYILYIYPQVSVGWPCTDHTGSVVVPAAVGVSMTTLP